MCSCAEGKKARVKGEGEGEGVRGRGELVLVGEEVEGNRIRAQVEKRGSLFHNSDAVGADNITNAGKKVREFLPKLLERKCGVRYLESHLNSTTF